MPKIVDHEQRRHAVAEATWRVILRDGLENTSFIAIAHELGSTTGVLAHYFKNKDALMLFALNRAMGNPKEQHIENTFPISFERLQHALEHMLPLAPARVTAWKVWIAFLGYAISRPPLLKIQQQRYQDYRSILKTELIAMVKHQLIPASTDLDATIAGMIALVDGIGVGFVLEAKQYPPERQKQLIKAYLQALPQ
jgi:AcrR family transcriptional regulator